MQEATSVPAGCIMINSLSKPTASNGHGTVLLPVFGILHAAACCMQ